MYGDGLPGEDACARVCASGAGLCCLCRPVADGEGIAAHARSDGDPMRSEGHTMGAPHGNTMGDPIED